MKAQPAPIVSGRYFFPKAPVLWTNLIPLERVISTKWTGEAGGPAAAAEGGSRRAIPATARVARASPRRRTANAGERLLIFLTAARLLPGGRQGGGPARRTPAWPAWPARRPKPELAARAASRAEPRRARG